MLARRLGEYHRGGRRYSNADIDALIGIRRDSTEARLDFTDLILTYGHHRVDTGDFPYRIIRRAFRRLAGYSWSSLLDIGCGYGRVLFYAAALFECRGYGIELIAERAREAARVRQHRGWHAIQIQQGDITRLDWPPADCYFVMNSVLPEYMPDLSRRVDAIARQRRIFVVSHSTANQFFAALPSLHEFAADPRAGSFGLKTYCSKP